jgi:hypothetical protein
MGAEYIGAFLVPCQNSESAAGVIGVTCRLRNSRWEKIEVRMQDFPPRGVDHDGSGKQNLKIGGHISRHMLTKNHTL